MYKLINYKLNFKEQLIDISELVNDLADEVVYLLKSDKNIEEQFDNI